MQAAKDNGFLPNYSTVREKVLVTLDVLPVRKHGCPPMQKKVSNKDVKVVEIITILYTYGKIL